MLNLLPLHVQTLGKLFVWEVNPETFARLPIRTGTHCLGCTAGSGSSCSGALT